MNQQPTAHPDYESLKTVWNSIAQWVMNHRHARGIYNDLVNCDPDEIERIARDLKSTEASWWRWQKRDHTLLILLKNCWGLLASTRTTSNTKIRLLCAISSGYAQLAPKKSNASLTLPTALLAIIFVTIARMPLHLMHF